MREQLGSTTKPSALATWSQMDQSMQRVLHKCKRINSKCYGQKGQATFLAQHRQVVPVLEDTHI